MAEEVAVTQQDQTWKQWFDVPPVFIVGCARSGTNCD